MHRRGTAVRLVALAAVCLVVALSASSSVVASRHGADLALAAELGLDIEAPYFRFAHVEAEGLAEIQHPLQTPPEVLSRIDPAVTPAPAATTLGPVPTGPVEPPTSEPVTHVTGAEATAHAELAAIDSEVAALQAKAAPAVVTPTDVHDAQPNLHPADIAALPHPEPMVNTLVPVALPGRVYTEDEARRLWGKHLAKFAPSKPYTKEESEARYVVFKANLVAISEQNFVHGGGFSSKAAFADLTPKEFSRMRGLTYKVKQVLIDQKKSSKERALAARESAYHDWKVFQDTFGATKKNPYKTPYNETAAGKARLKRYHQAMKAKAARIAAAAQAKVDEANRLVQLKLKQARMRVKKAEAKTARVLAAAAKKEKLAKAKAAQKLAVLNKMAARKVANTQKKKAAAAKAAATKASRAAKALQAKAAAAAKKAAQAQKAAAAKAARATKAAAKKATLAKKAAATKARLAKLKAKKKPVIKKRTTRLAKKKVPINTNAAITNPVVQPADTVTITNPVVQPVDTVTITNPVVQPANAPVSIINPVVQPTSDVTITNPVVQPASATTITNPIVPTAITNPVVQPISIPVAITNPVVQPANTVAITNPVVQPVGLFEMTADVDTDADFDLEVDHELEDKMDALADTEAEIEADSDAEAEAEAEAETDLDAESDAELGAELDADADEELVMLETDVELQDWLEGESEHSIFAEQTPRVQPTSIADPSTVAAIVQPGMDNNYKLTAADKQYASNKNIIDIDWRTKDVLTAPKSQGQCGSCWAQSAAAVLESAISIKNNSAPVPLSVQQMVSCDLSDQACDGGNPITALAYLTSYDIALESDYPYDNNVFTSGAPVPSCNDTRVPGGFPLVKDSVSYEDEVSIAQALLRGPLAALVDASKWQFYDGSKIVYPASGCGSTVDSLDHSVVIVGLGTLANGERYWIVRNHWGSSWGAGGYIFLSYGTNTCGISIQATEVLLSEKGMTP